MEITNAGFPALPKINTNLIDQKTGQVSGASNSIAETGKTFKELLDGLSETEMYSNNLLQQLAAGEDVDLHQVMIAVEQTDVSFRVALSIRDKLVESYREIMRMQI